MDRLKCYGWYWSQNGILKPNLPLSEQEVTVRNGRVYCAQKCDPCIFDDTPNTPIHCTGLRDDGEMRFFWTVRQAYRNNGHGKCQLMEGEQPCQTCLLKLKKSGC